MAERLPPSGVCKAGTAPERRRTQLAGGEAVSYTHLDVYKRQGVFVALGVAGSTALARKIGAEVDGNRIVVDEKMQATVPGPVSYTHLKGFRRLL